MARDEETKAARTKTDASSGKKTGSKKTGTGKKNKKTRAEREMKDPVFAGGMEVRRAMWGPEGAEGQINAAGDFIWPLQDIVTRYCFGQTWTRPKLSRKTRSMITLAMLVAMARPHELGVHVRGAIANGVTKDELQELLIHAMVYAGIPLGVEAFRTAEATLKDMGLE